MKKLILNHKIKLIILLLQLFIFNYIFSQTVINHENIKGLTTTELVFDCGQQPCTLTKYRPKFIKEGTAITLKYINVNPFAINSNVKGEIINADYKDGADALQSILTSWTIAQKKALDQSNTLNTVKKQNPLIPENNKPLTKDNASGKKQRHIDSIILLLKSKTECLKKVNEVRLSLSLNIDAISNLLDLDRIIDITMKDSSFTSKDIMLIGIKNATDISFDSNNISKLSELFNKNLKEAREYIGSLKEQFYLLTDINNQIKSIENSSGNQYTFDDLLNTFSSAISDLDNAYIASKNVKDMRNKIMNIRYNYIKICHTEFNVIGKTTFFINDDELDISDSLLTIHKSLYRKISPMKFYSYGGTRIDLALGLAVSFGNLNPTSYYIVRDASGKATDLKNSRVNSIGNFSPMIFIHFTKKWNSSISVALSVGLNPDFSTIGNSKLLLGFSLACTQTNNIAQRLVFTAGIGGGLTNVLLPKYGSINSTNADYLLSSKSETELTEKALRFGPFFAVSFNLGRLNKGK